MTPSPGGRRATDGPGSAALEIEIVGDRVTLAGTTTLAGSVIALDTAVRNLVAAGVGLPAAVAAASRNPLAMLGVTTAAGSRSVSAADLVELDDRVLARARGSWSRSRGWPV